ncbi:hypothetical protein ABEY41_03230 [Peribacillus butanolivorans]|uniref:hypothetical protein n=1 Tax=Peribacillus butanolivorans TaxID=421767 RepID=UPI003D29EDCC
MSKSETLEQKKPPKEADKEPVETFPSAELLLSVIQSEYTVEAERKRDFESRSGILIALLGALIGFYGTEVDFSFFNKADSSLEIVSIIFISLLYIFPVIMLLISFKHLLNVLKTKEYQRIGLGGFTVEVSKIQRDDVAKRLMVHYKDIVTRNGKENDAKANEFKLGIKNLYIALIAIVVVFFIKEIITII